MRDFQKLASQLGALDREVKLKIIALLTEKGAYSITDISKELNLNFSTTHKYLEQLEKAGFLKSDTVLKNRLKRLFYVKDFDISISPKKLVDEKKEHHQPKKGLRVINQNGQIMRRDISKLVQEYLSYGVPITTIEEGVRLLEECAYDGVTTFELENIFRKFLVEKVNNLQSAIFSMTRVGPKREYCDALKPIYPQMLVMHMNGDIFVRNLGEPRLLNFIHDLRGITVHGVGGRAPRNLSEVLKQIINAIKQVSEYSYPTQAFDSFNFNIAPFIFDKLTDVEIYRELKEFFVKLDKLNIKLFFGIDIGVSKFAKLYGPVYVFGEKDVKYAQFNDKAQRINSQISNILKEEKLSNISFVFKLWEEKLELAKNMSNVYVANMTPKWQTENANYAGATRFDSSWKKYTGLVRVGEVQEIVINLPRLSLRAKSKKDFFDKLKVFIDSCTEYIFAMIDLTHGEFLRKHKTTFRSAEKGQWSYVSLDDCSYSLSLIGLNETLHFLSNKTPKQENLAVEILNFCNKCIKEKTRIPVRIVLRECLDQAVADRFYHLDSKENKLDVKEYTIGSHSLNLEVSQSLQKYLLGGHCLTISNKNLDKLKKDEFGLVYIQR